MVQTRTRRLASGIASSLVSRGIGLLAPLVLIPFALKSIGVERYGLWTAAASLTAIALFTDLGLGNGLLTRLTSTYASGNAKLARQLTASAYAMTAIIALTLATLVAVIVPLTGAARWLDSGSTVPISEANAILILCLLAFAVNIPITLIQRVQYAYQQVTYSNLWVAAASIASVVAFVLLTECGFNATVAIAGAVFAVPLVGLLNTLVFFGFQRRDLSPAKTWPQLTYAKNLLRLGGLFFVLSVLTSISLNIDPLLISRQLGLEATAEYAVGWRVASTLGLIVTLVNLPLWPANGEALARGDTAWVKRITTRMIIISSALVLLSGLVLLGPGRALIDAWLGTTTVRPSTALLVALVVWNLLLAATSPVMMVQNSVGLLWPQITGWGVFLIVVVPMKWLGIQAWGIAGGPVVASAIYIVSVLPMAALGMHKALKRAERNPNDSVTMSESTSTVLSTDGAN